MRDRADAVVAARAKLKETIAEKIVEDDELEEEEEDEEVRFHKSDHARTAEPPPTIEERDKAPNTMADLYESDPLAYVELRKKWSRRLSTPQTALDKAVKIIRDKRVDDREQSQATKLVAIGVGERVVLWHGTDGAGYATVLVNDHYENYRIEHRGFERWLLTEYGRLNVCKVGDKWVPQSPGSASVRDAIRSLEGIARIKGKERQPALRVGGNRDVILLDLGRPDWRMVEITANGWKVVPGSNKHVAFLRSEQTLKLPEPTRGGSIQMLREVLNVQASQFVLAVGWLLQGMNPIGPYPLIDAEGPSEAGKTSVCRTLLRVFDPSAAGLRKARRVEDLLISARNNWAIGFDNLSGMSADWSDTLCMLATGIASGTRAHYTNDEEHVFTVQRPVVFNGIPADLIHRSDLASRAIKLEILPITSRRTERALEADFVRIWPGVLGALLDGLVGALKGCDAITVDDPARMIDFEQFAEAGCRAMGFKQWEFVNTYAINRKRSMVISVETNAVGRAVMAFLKKNPKGFEGQMSALYQKLEAYRWTASFREWPPDATRLSSALRTIAKPLAAIGITCLLNVDRRIEGGTQHDVILKWATKTTQAEPSRPAFDRRL